jgi:hypothetical protein
MDQPLFSGASVGLGQVEVADLNSTGSKTINRSPKRYSGARWTKVFLPLGLDD